MFVTNFIKNRWIIIPIGLFTAILIAYKLNYIGKPVYRFSHNFMHWLELGVLTHVVYIAEAEHIDADLIPAAERPLWIKLMSFMDEGGYRQTELTITVLALQLETPEHHLK